jgi:hypothetical protein
VTPPRSLCRKTGGMTVLVNPLPGLEGAQPLDRVDLATMIGACLLVAMVTHTCCHLIHICHACHQIHMSFEILNLNRDARAPVFRNLCHETAHHCHESSNAHSSPQLARRLHPVASKNERISMSNRIETQYPLYSQRPTLFAATLTSPRQKTSRTAILTLRFSHKVTRRSGPKAASHDRLCQSGVCLFLTNCLDQTRKDLR